MYIKLEQILIYINVFRYSCNQIKKYFFKIEMLFIYSEFNLSVNLILKITLPLVVHHLCIMLYIVLNNETNKAFLISILEAFFMKTDIGFKKKD